MNLDTVWYAKVRVKGERSNTKIKNYFNLTAYCSHKTNNIQTRKFLKALKGFESDINGQCIFINSV